MTYFKVKFASAQGSTIILFNLLDMLGFSDMIDELLKPFLLHCFH